VLLQLCKSKPAVRLRHVVDNVLVLDKRDTKQTEIDAAANILEIAKAPLAIVVNGRAS